MKRFSVIITMLSVILMFQTASSQVKNETISGQSFNGEISIDAPPQEVWNILTDAGQITDVLGYAYNGGTEEFSEIGDHARIEVWEDDATLMMVYSNPVKELRYTVEPDNGSYICNCSWVLTESGDQTKLRFEERYTESGKQTEESLKAQVKELNEALNELKSMAETETETQGY